MGSCLLTVIKDRRRLHFEATMWRYIILFVLLFMLAQSEARKKKDERSSSSSSADESQWGKGRAIIKNAQCTGKSKGETQHVHNCRNYKGGKCCSRKEDGTDVVWNGGRDWDGECGYCFTSSARSG